MDDVSERHKESRNRLFTVLNRWRTVSPSEYSDEPVYEALHDHEEAVEQAIREPLESRLEAYETAVREAMRVEYVYDDGYCRSCGYELPSQWTSLYAMAYPHKEACPVARLRELSGQPENRA